MPLLPCDMPVVNVRPSKYKSRSPGKALFKVDVRKLRRAYDWPKKHNPYYFDVEWQDEAAKAWEAEDVQVGTVREANDDIGQSPPISAQCFRQWMSRAQSEVAARDNGYPIGRRVLDMLAAETEYSDAELWDLAHRIVAEVFGRSVCRAATSLPQGVALTASSHRGVVEWERSRDLASVAHIRHRRRQSC